MDFSEGPAAHREHIMAGGARSARSILARERERQAVELRNTGASYAEIGAILRISTQSAFNAVKKAVDRIIATTSESAEHVRVQELAKLDRIELAHWSMVDQADPKSSAVVLRCMERRAALLGLDAAKKVEVEDVTDVDSTIERLLERLRAGREIPPPMEIVGSSRTDNPPWNNVVELVDNGRKRLGEDARCTYSNSDADRLGADG